MTGDDQDITPNVYFRPLFKRLDIPMNLIIWKFIIGRIPEVSVADVFYELQ